MKQCSSKKKRPLHPLADVKKLCYLQKKTGSQNQLIKELKQMASKLNDRLAVKKRIGSFLTETLIEQLKAEEERLRGERNVTPLRNAVRDQLQHRNDPTKRSDAVERVIRQVRRRMGSTVAKEELTPARVKKACDDLFIKHGKEKGVVKKINDEALGMNPDLKKLRDRHEEKAAKRKKMMRAR